MLYLMSIVRTDTTTGGVSPNELPERVEVALMRRRRMSRRSSKRAYRKGRRVKRKNFRGKAMRGGIRL